MGCRVGDAFIERHDNVGTQLVLYSGCFARSDEDSIAIDFMFKKDPVIGNLFFGEGENLKAATVGQDWL